MIKAGISFLVIIMFLTWSNYLHAQPLDRWELVWSDEFNGTSLDTSKWALELNEGDPGIAVYTRRPQNVFVQNGCLALQALQENYNGKQYSSTQLAILPGRRPCEAAAGAGHVAGDLDDAEQPRLRNLAAKRGN
jgi:hypothetical protein